MRSLAALLLSAAICWAAPVPRASSPDPMGFGYLGVRASDNGEMVIQTPDPDSPAGLAGLRGGDRLLQVGPVKPKAFADVRRFIGGQRPGAAVRVVVMRHEAETTVTVILGNMPDDVLETYRLLRTQEMGLSGEVAVP